MKKYKKKYNSTYFKARYQKNYKRLIDYKLERGCKDCGYKLHHAALEFDHLPKFEKLDSPVRFLGRGWNSVQKEIDKCDVVCSNCHSIRTWKRKQTPDSSSGQDA